LSSSTHYLALDQGGHASRALLFSPDGELLATGEHEIATVRYGRDRVEHEPEELVKTLRDSAAEALRGLPEEADLVAGLATQRSSLVCWDRESGEALSPVLSWQDRRASAELDELAPVGSEIHEWIYKETGLAVSPHYGASKYGWCLAELLAVAHAQREGRLAMGPLASYLLSALLTERPWVADPANGARTQLCSLETGRWSEELLNLFSIPSGLLPPIQPNRSPFGTLEVEGRPIPLGLCTGDQSAALFAFGRPPSGRVSVNAGTGVFLQMLLESETRVGRLLTAAVHEGADERLRSVEGSINGGAAALHHVADGMGIDTETLHNSLDDWARAATEPPLFINGVSGLASPFWVPHLASRFFEEQPSHTDSDRLVAVLESIVFLIAENLAAIQSSGVALDEIVLTGGLASSDVFVERIGQLTGLPIYRPSEREATARGVAWLLGCNGMSGLPEGCRREVWEPSGVLMERFGRWREALRDVLSEKNEVKEGSWRLLSGPDFGR